MKKIILASGSPRRKELLEQLGWQFDIMPAQGEEVIRKELPADIVRELSYQKAMEIAGKAPEESIVIGADTMVAFGNEVMGKPKDAAQAKEMLQKLQGNTHQVYTGVTVVVREGDDCGCFTFHESTDVLMYPMTDDEISAYTSTGEPLDKAGAYAVQGRAAKYVKGIRGEYSNVVGLPVARLFQEMKRRGLLQEDGD